ncbi:MAG: hypothetical protein WC828_03400 [Thermoleophilia bacterium]
MKQNEFSELESALRKEALAVSDEGRTWTASEVSRRLTEIADALKNAGHTNKSVINASMGKRSGWKVDI